MADCLHDVRAAERHCDVQETCEVAGLPPSPVLSGCCYGPGTNAQELPRGPRGAAAAAETRKGGVPKLSTKGLEERLVISGATYKTTGLRGHSDGRTGFQRQPLGRASGEMRINVCSQAP